MTQEQKGAIIEAREAFAVLLIDIEWTENSITKKMVKRALKRLDDEVINASKGYPLEHYNDFLERKEIMRHNEEGMEELAKILADGLRGGV